MEQGRAFIRFCDFRGDLFRAINQGFQRGSSSADELWAYHILFGARGAGFAVFAARDFRTLGYLLAVIRADNDRIRIGSFTATCFRFTPYAVTVVGSRIMVYLRVTR